VHSALGNPAPLLLLCCENCAHVCHHHFCELQARGRARKQGSEYFWLVPRSADAAEKLTSRQIKLVR
jgi:hypothetical protein